jgi:hypothetical protein
MTDHEHATMLLGEMLQVLRVRDGERYGLFHEHILARF